MAMPDKNKIKNEIARKYGPERSKAHSLNNTDAGNQKQSITNKYNREIDKAGDAYAPYYSEAAVQKYINEKQIAENMANLGLADSGVKELYGEENRNTYLNTEGSLDISKQKDISSLSAELSDAVADIEKQRVLKAKEIDDRYDSLIDQAAETRYEQEKAAEEQRIAQAEFEKMMKQNIINSIQQAQQKPKYYKLLGSGKNSLGKTTYSFVDENGRQWTFDEGINPYTGRRIAGYTNAQLKRYGVWNGYQPKGVVYNGRDYGKVELENSLASNYQGHDKNIWKTVSRGKKGSVTKYWVWDDYKNGGSYIPVYKENDEWVIY